MIEPNEIIRSNRKTLSIKIDCCGRVTVRAPRRCDKERIFAFLQEKEDWILRQKAKIQRAGIVLPSENLDGYELLLLGEKHQVTLSDERFVRLDTENKRIFLPKKNAEKRLVKWLKDNAERILKNVTAAWAKKMQTGYKDVKISSARGKWGSCSGDNLIRYSFRLLYAPREVIDYVVVHELAHTLVKNHSNVFWSVVETYVPDYKIKRKWLKERAALMRVL